MKQFSLPVLTSAPTNALQSKNLNAPAYSHKTALLARANMACIAALAITTILSLPAQAAPDSSYSVVRPQGSSIRFVSKQMGVKVNGNFAKYTAKISFDPQKPDNANAQIEIAIASIDVGSADANYEVKSKGWFDVVNFPTATFVSNSVRVAAPQHFEVSGKLTIKGKTREVRVPVTSMQTGKFIILEGSLPILRSQFGIGEGVWSDTETVADEVEIPFRFTLEKK